MIEVAVKDVVEGLELVSDDYHVFLDTRSGEFIGLSDENLRDAGSDESFEDYPDWNRELIAQARDILGSDSYVELPSRFDIREYRIMERFTYSIESQELSDRLLQAIKSRGAFRRFKDIVFEQGIESDWHSYRTRALEEIAVEWLEDNNIPWRRDTGC